MAEKRIETLGEVQVSSFPATSASFEAGDYVGLNAGDYAEPIVISGSLMPLGICFVTKDLSSGFAAGQEQIQVITDGDLRVWDLVDSDVDSGDCGKDLFPESPDSLVLSGAAVHGPKSNCKLLQKHDDGSYEVRVTVPNAVDKY